MDVITSLCRDHAFISAYERAKEARPTEMEKDADLAAVASKHKVFLKRKTRIVEEPSTDSMRRIEAPASFRRSTVDEIEVYTHRDSVRGVKLEVCYRMALQQRALSAAHPVRADPRV